MGLSGQNSSQTYKIKLQSGRILGPLDCERIRLLILKNQITGTETAREYPQGEWKDINLISALSELLIAKITGELEKQSLSHLQATKTVDPLGATAVLSPLPGADQFFESQPLATLPELKTPEPDSSSDEDKTRVEPLSSERAPPIELDDSEKTRVASAEDLQPAEEPVQNGSEIVFDEEAEPLEVGIDPQERNISQERTVVFQRSSDSINLPGKRRASPIEILKAILAAVVLGIVGYELFLAEPDVPMASRLEPIRPKLPAYIQGRSDPEKSMQVYNNAMIKYYLADTVEGYRIAAEKFRYSAALDIANVKALAMLASSYLNLIDSSNKDENYFSVISKLIDMSRAKAVDLPETVIADVEFYIVVNKAEAAKNRIAEYTTLHQNFGFEMFYYIALAFHEKGDPVSAAKYLSQFPESKIFTPKIFYLKGQIAEKLKDTSAALAEYKKAIKFNPNHARSHLKIAEILSKQGSLKDSAVHLDFLITHINLLAPKEIAQTYFLHAQLSELYQKWNLALGDVERAVKLDPENHDYLLELYTLRARVGESIADARKQARMYYFLGEGEKLILQGKHQDALIPLLQARQLNDASPLPLLKMGDMFTYIHDVQNAKNNYKLAAARAPNNIQVWSKYIQALIQSFEWDEAKKAMDKFRNLPVSQSAIDKAAADMYQKQGRYAEAQGLYRKAMQRDLIDPDVYIAYAKSLMSTRNFKDAPFFFALALRFDPLNVDAIMNTAKCVAETESIDRAISMLQDELRMRSGSRAEFLSAIAELQIQKGSWEEAQKSVDEAIQLDQNYAYPWKLQAQIYMNREGQDRDALSKALFAYKSYSERNASDPSGYLERYKIFIKKTDFESSKEELKKIYEIYPKYPNLHFYFGKLYGIQGNHRAAAEEFKVELANNPDSVPTLIEYGKSLLELNFASEALKLFTKAMQLAPELADPKQNAGWTNYKLKNYQAAIALIRAALVIDKGNPAIYKRLGIVFRDMGDTSSACAAFKKYLEMEPDAPDKSELRSCL